MPRGRGVCVDQEKKKKRWACSSVAEHVPEMNEALGSIPALQTQQTNQKTQPNPSPKPKSIWGRTWWHLPVFRKRLWKDDCELPGVRERR